MISNELRDRINKRLFILTGGRDYRGSVCGTFDAIPDELYEKCRYCGMSKEAHLLSDVVTEDWKQRQALAPFIVAIVNTKDSPS